ncbi:MAG: hypothetical protein WD534_15290 [Phycisphaeraceae bacterium]
MTEQVLLEAAITASIMPTVARRVTGTNHHMLQAPTAELCRVMWRLDNFTRRNLGGAGAAELYALAYPHASPPAWLSRRHLRRCAGFEPMPETWTATDIHCLIDWLETFELYRLVRVINDLMQQQAWTLASANQLVRSP